MIAGTRLGFTLLRGRELHGRVRRDRPGGLHHHRGRLLLARDGQKRFVVEGGFHAFGRRGRRLACAQAGEVEHVRKHHLDAGRPIGAIEAEAVGAAVELGIRIRPAPTAEHARLYVDARKIRAREHVLLRADKVDRRLVDVRQRMPVRRGRRHISGGQLLEQP